LRKRGWLAQEEALPGKEIKEQQEEQPARLSRTPRR